MPYERYFKCGFPELKSHPRLSSDWVRAWAFMGYLLPPGTNLTNTTKWSHKKKKKKSLYSSSLGKMDKFILHICLRESETSLIFLPSNLCPLQNNWNQLCVLQSLVHFITVRSRARNKQEEEVSFITALKNN